MITMRYAQLVMKRYQLELELLDIVASGHHSDEQFQRQMRRVRRAERALEWLLQAP
jgi:hypothetical protein